MINCNSVYWYRHIVHVYLDGIWLISTSRKTARKTMYKLLATKMNIDIESTHISKFTKRQCKTAISILKPMYIQLNGEDIDYYAERNNFMYYFNGQLKFTINISDTKITNIDVTIYCRRKNLNNKGNVECIDDVIKKLNKSLKMEELKNHYGYYPTMEEIAVYIYEQIMTCYKVKIVDENNNEFIYEEEKV